MPEKTDEFGKTNNSFIMQQSKLRHINSKSCAETNTLTKETRDAYNQIETLFSKVEKKCEKMVYGGVIEESLRNSIFGVFGAHYGLYKNNQQKEGMGLFLKFFEESKILDERLFRALMYFNLPYEIIIQAGIKPDLKYSWEDKGSS